MSIKNPHDNTGVLAIMSILIILLISAIVHLKYFAYSPITITICQTQKDYIAVLDNGQVFRGDNIDTIVGQAMKYLYTGSPDEKKMISLKVIPQQIRIIPKDTTTQSSQ